MFRAGARERKRPTAGVSRVGAIQPVDMFPYTEQIEKVVKMTAEANERKER